MMYERNPPRVMAYGPQCVMSPETFGALKRVSADDAFLLPVGEQRRAMVFNYARGRSMWHVVEVQPGGRLLAQEIVVRIYAGEAAPC